MILWFRCLETKAIHEGFGSRKFRGIEEQARKRLRWLDAATSLTVSTPVEYSPVSAG
jgi:hypothetical protein